MAAAAALLGALCAAQGVRPVLVKTPPSPLAPGEEVAPPAWLPADALFEGAAGRTNVVTLEARWLFAPVAGRPAYAWLSYSNRTAHACLFERVLGDYRDRRGVLPLAVAADGVRQALAGFPDCAGLLSPGAHFESGERQSERVRLPASTVDAAAGAAGLVFAYVDHEEPYVFWAESAALPVPAASTEPGTAGTNEWAQLVGFWAAHGMGYPARPSEILSEFPEFAPFFPGVVLDASLPEAFRIEFANRMPLVDAYDPAVAAFITNAVDKTAPLVFAAIDAFRRQNPAQDAGGEDWDAAAAQFRAMAADATLPRTFRLRLFRSFTKPPWYAAFVAQTDPHFRLTAAHAILPNRASLYQASRRDAIRQGLQALTGDTAPFDAAATRDASLQGKTVGEVATLFLAEFEAKWAAEPPPPE
jgi:hypothetical protein